MTPRPFQFTLRHLFITVAYFSVAFALAALWLRIENVVEWADTPGKALAWLIGPFIVLALMGAGVGQLFGKTLRGAVAGMLFGALLCFAFVFWVEMQ